MLTETERPPEEVQPGDGCASPNGQEAGVPDCVTIWGLRLARLTHQQTLDQIERLIERGKPAYFITANLNYAMLSARDPRLRPVNERAALILADGMPLVWYSRILRRPLPERVTGADLISMLLERAAERGYTAFLLGGAGGVADEVARIFRQRYPGVGIVGVEAPMLDDLSPEEHDQLVERIRRARPDLLLVAFGQPKGEVWMAENCQALGVPACVQLGASFDFLVGRIPRAPKWMQRIGAEWLYRTWCEPRRLIPRYFQNAVFLAAAVGRDLLSIFRRRK